LCVAPTALGVLLAVHPALTGWANLCRPYGAGSEWRGVLWWRFALECLGNAGVVSKAGAEPPHSTVGWACWGCGRCARICRLGGACFARVWARARTRTELLGFADVEEVGLEGGQADVEAGVAEFVAGARVGYFV
jgi:hypothetical protein